MANNTVQSIVNRLMYRCMSFLFSRQMRGKAWKFDKFQKTQCHLASMKLTSIVGASDDEDFG